MLIRNRRLLEQALAEVQDHTSPSFSASVLVIAAFPSGPGTASLVERAIFRQRFAAVAGQCAGGPGPQAQTQLLSRHPLR